MGDLQLLWDIYEISSQNSPLRGVMLRGRIRKFGVEQGINLLVENTEDTPSGVRFGVLGDQDASAVKGYIKSIIDGARIASVAKQIPNPVLSKLKVNIESRYTL